MSIWTAPYMQQIVTPIVIGLLTSLMFLMLMSQVRPRIEISTEIAKVQSKKQPGKYAYVVKVVNKSKRASVDIKARFAIVQDKNVPDGIIKKKTDFVLEKDTEFEMPGLTRSNPDMSALRFITYDDLEAVWIDERAYLLFMVHAKDAFSGFGKVFSQKYYLKRVAIKDGTFKVGMSMQIV